MFDALVPVIGYTLAVASLMTLAVCALINTVRGK
jgi:hypothetical protein